MGHFPWLSQITRGYVIRKCNSSNVADIFITPQAIHLSVLLDIIEKIGTHHIPSLPIPIVLYLVSHALCPLNWLLQDGLPLISTVLPSGHPECCRRASDADHSLDWLRQHKARSPADLKCHQEIRAVVDPNGLKLWIWWTLPSGNLT